jgi:accessory colonization factor AcfC
MTDQSDDSGDGLIIYSAYVPSVPLSDAAKVYGEREGVEIEVRAGRPEKWMPSLRDGTPADMISCGAEYLLDLAEAEGLLRPNGRRSLGRRRAALMVPAGNPAGIRGLEDLARDDVRTGIAVEGCTLGMWDEIAGSAGLANAIRSRITARAKGCGDLIRIVNQNRVDAAVGWASFQNLPSANIEIIDLPERLSVQRSTGIGITANPRNPELAEAFLGWLGTEEARAIYRGWGWLVDAEESPAAANAANPSAVAGN